MLEMMPFAREPRPSRGPGPNTLVAGNEVNGFFGETTVDELISGSQLAATIRLTTGTAINSNEPWLKFVSDGKILYVAKKPFRHSLHGASIHAHNNKQIEIDGRTYILRSLAKNSKAYSGDKIDPVEAYGSEWNKLMYRIVATPVGISNEGIPFGEWAQYTNAELGLTGANGYMSYILGTDTGKAGATNSLWRGYWGVTDRVVRNHYGNFIGGSIPHARGWRPVLELVD